MGIERLENANPVLYDSKPRRTFNTSSNELDLDLEEPIDAEEVFEYIRDISKFILLKNKFFQHKFNSHH